MTPEPVLERAMSPSVEEYHLAKIAWLYYREELNLREISDKLNVSVATVSRSLSAAKRRGIVEIRINDPNSNFRELEVELERAWSLRECIVVPTFERKESVTVELAHALDDLFARLLRPGMLMGVSWGRTLHEIGNHLAVNRRLAVDTIPVVGAMGTIEMGIYPNAIARSYAEKLGGRNYQVNALATLDSAAVRDSVFKESKLQLVHQLWDRVDVLLASVSGLQENASMAQHNLISQRCLDYYRERGAVCATNFIMLNRKGRQVTGSLDERMIRMSLAQLLGVRHRILVAHGPFKTEPIRAALAGKVPTILLTDLANARKLL